MPIDLDFGRQAAAIRGLFMILFGFSISITKNGITEKY
jgi:hypothetical protein